MPDQTSIFYPSSSGQWRKDSVNLTSAINNTVVIRFVSESGYGNSLYIDNINIIAGGVVAPVSSFATSKNTVCVNDTMTFTSTATGVVNTYNWNFGASAVPATANTAGPHIVYYTSGGPKTASLTVSNPGGANNSTNNIAVVSEPMSQFNAVNNATLAVSFTDLSTNNPTAWTWDFGDGNSSNLQNPTHTYASGGQYNVQLTAANDCGSTDSIIAVYVSGIGIDETNLANGILLLPNPASQWVSLRANFDSSTDLKLEILDVTGKVLDRMNWNDARSGNDYRVDLTGMPEGVYLIKIQDGESSATKRLIVRK